MPPTICAMPRARDAAASRLLRMPLYEPTVGLLFGLLYRLRGAMGIHMTAGGRCWRYRRATSLLHASPADGLRHGFACPRFGLPAATPHSGNCHRISYFSHIVLLAALMATPARASTFSLGAQRKMDGMT